MAEKKWKYCAVGNIVKTHLDENGVLRYGTTAFTGGTKVYLEGKFWDETQKTVSAIGLNRGKRYQVVKTPIELIENVRSQRVYRPSVLEIMDHWEFYTCWWGAEEEDLKEVKAFINRWNNANRQR